MEQPKGLRPDRHASESFEDILERDSRYVPDYLRQGPVRDLGDAGVPVTNYFDPDHFVREVRHVWLKVWQWACREEDIPKPGDVFVYENVGKSVMVVRQRNGSIKAFYNSCPHRGRKLADGACRKSELRCKYHGLAWNMDGSFKDNPIAWDFPQFEREAPTLPELKLETWGGFVFINFDDSAPPLMEVIGPLADHFERFDFANRYKASHVSKVVPVNWKIMAEAFMESHHTIVTHPQLAPFLGDVNSQYDILSDHVTRQFTATAVASPALESRKLTEADILKAMDAAGGSHVSGGKGGPEDADSLEEGVTARIHAAEVTRRGMQELDGWDYSSISDAEMIDALLYNVFPHMSFWASFAPNVVYRWRPNGLDPESSIMDVIILMRAPKVGDRPPPVKEERLSLEQAWSSSEAVGALGPVFEQDMANLPQVQAGLKTSGTGVVHFSRYSEMRIRHMHQMIDRMIAEGEAKSG